jgi:hypothetical protein
MSYNTKKFPMLLVIAFVLTFGTGLAYAYLYSQANLAENRLSVIDREITEVKNQLEESKTSTSSSAQIAVTSLEAIKQTEITWSTVMEAVQKIIPLDLVDLKPMVQFTTYSGQQNGVLTFNGHTNPSSDVKFQLDSIAQTISTFNSSPVFTNAFVPSISKSVNQDDQTILSFVFNVSYKGSSASKTGEDTTVTRK